MTNKTDAQASLERIQNFEEAFARIRSATGIEDIEELVSEAGGGGEAGEAGRLPNVKLHRREASLQ